MTLAAAYSDFELTWMEGLTPEQVDKSSLPPGDFKDEFDGGNRASWRAHMNILQTIVEQNISTALILEDDVDWDVRIRDQLRDFALASRAMLQPLASDGSTHMDPTFFSSENESEALNFDFDSLPPVVEPVHSLYGDNWDVLWLGHCGTYFPDAGEHTNHSLARVVHADDETVPEPIYIEIPFGSDVLLREYAPHTRLIHQPREPCCSFAYAVTQAGARRILYELGVHSMNANFDIELRDVCDGFNGRAKGRCLIVQPELFNAHIPTGNMGAMSDISNGRPGINQKAYTPTIRMSARVNFPRFLAGSEDFIDQWPDSEPL